MKVVVIDNYDSFVYNLVQYIGQTGADPIVFRNDKVTLDRLSEIHPDRIVISPGPGNPCERRYFGVCIDVLHHLSVKVPTLGVCLGHQGIAHAFGGRIRRARRLMHGKTSLITHDGAGVFKGLGNPLEATRYHSLVVEPQTLPKDLIVTAESCDDREVMGLRHAYHPIEGVQFHPESVLTHEGMRIIKNFIDGG